MYLNRRNFVKFLGLSSLLTAEAALSQAVLSHQQSKETLVSCYDDQQNKHYIALLDPITGQSSSLPIKQRGHGVCISPDKKHCLVFARRPGTLIWVVDLQQQKIVQQINSPENRHFYGHGVFEPTGRYLYVTENDFASGRGIIGVYDAQQNYQRSSEFDSQGIGPHELALLSDGKTLVVANGGIKTHPDLGRSKLNLNSMKPNLAYFNISENQFLAKYSLAKQFHQLSMRHISVGIDNTVSIAMQFQGPRNQHPPLLAQHQGKREITLLNAPDLLQKQMKNYCGSICHDPSGQYFALSSPRGDIVSFWSNKGQYLHHIKANDGCGLASGQNKGEILVSTGQGLLFKHQIRHQHSKLIEQFSSGKHWDNHMLTLNSRSVLL